MRDEGRLKEKERKRREDRGLTELGNNPIIVVANKADLLPTGATEERVEKWIRKSLKDRNVRNVVSVKIISSLTGQGTEGGGGKEEGGRRERRRRARGRDSLEKWIRKSLKDRKVRNVCFRHAN
jgi:ribosome biogenesis GTPase A